MVEHFLKQKQELLIHGSLFTPDQTFAWLSWTKWNIGKLLYKTICCVNMLKKLMVDTIHQKSGLSNKTNNILKHEQFDFWPVRECRWFPALSFGTFQTADSKDSVKNSEVLVCESKKKFEKMQYFSYSLHYSQFEQSCLYFCKGFHPKIFF